jgi:5'-nucleotidase (lipoprotein e(P4) family)
MRARHTAIAFILIVASTASCATSPAATTRTPAPAPATPATSSAPRPLPREIRWFRNSAEYRALALETYRSASEHLPDLTRGMPPGSWGVILDADETVLDNSEYQRRRAAVDSGYTDATWSAWVRERAATAVPGAVQFTTLVKTMHGRVAIVTNRADSLCVPTRENLQSIGVDADLVLCQPPGESDKNLRFQRIQTGTVAASIPALMIVEWVGDNILDFPKLSQAARGDSAALAQFGRRYFVLPNPMYGSWDRP